MKLDTLKQLFSNDEKLMKRFLDVFKADIPVQLIKLESAIKNKDWESVSITAHGIKSQVKYLDLTAIAGTAAIIEALADKREDLNSMPAQFITLKTPLLEVLATM